MIKKTLVLILLLFVQSVRAGITYDTNKFVLENRVIRKQIVISRTEPSGIYISSLLSGEKNYEMLAANNRKPYFEFILNQKLVTAADKVWQYDSHQVRRMGNGGEELKVVVQGKKKPVEGLRIIFYQQLFPGKSLIREKLALHNPDGKRFALNKLKGKLHFKFPQYSLAKASTPAVREIRIATWADELVELDSNATYDDRLYDDSAGDHSLAHCHMFHPQINHYKLSVLPIVTKGPINFLMTRDYCWFTAYEHASQDSRKGMEPFFSNQEPAAGISVNEQQGVAGDFAWEETDEDFHFLGIAQQAFADKIDISVDILRGGYLEGEPITPEFPFESVWTASAFYHQGGIDKGKMILRDYLLNLICEKPASRRPAFYYNTWGMQRELSSRGQSLRGVFTEDRIIEEIRRAAELGVDLFVLDDGWEQAQGIWTPHEGRLPEGLAPIKRELDRHDMVMGIWLSCMGIDKDTDRYREHPEWVIKDARGEPIRAQWNHPAFDFVGDFYDLFIQDCKKLIDQGARFFKWDAINTFNSTLATVHHGGEAYSPLERKQRYEYLLPLYVVKAMKELTDYEPELVIEIDVTEARRVLVGLAPLSYGKFFWGNLERMRQEQRLRIGRLVEKSKRVLPYIFGIEPVITGKIGASPEVYACISREKGAGQVIAFSGSALHYDFSAAIDERQVLCVLNHSYAIKDDTLNLPFAFSMPDDTREAFIIPNLDTGISIIASSGWLDDVKLEDARQLIYVNGAPGEQVVRWPGDLGKPSVRFSTEGNRYVMKLSESDFMIEIFTNEPHTKVVINGTDG